MDSTPGGLFMMTIMTIIWAVLAESYFNNLDYKIAGFVFAFICIYFIYSYVVFSRLAAKLPEANEPKDTKREKWYWTIFVLEGVAILIAKNILINMGKSNLFICCFALIVGLHFIPLVKVLKRPFLYYVAAWMIITASIGMSIIVQNLSSYNFVNALVYTASAMATAVCGLQMIREGKKIIASNFAQ